MSKRRLCAAYDKDGVCIAVGDGVIDLAQQLHKTPSTVYKGCAGRSERYAYIMSDTELEAYEKKIRKTG